MPSRGCLAEECSGGPEGRRQWRDVIGWSGRDFGRREEDRDRQGRTKINQKEGKSFREGRFLRWVGGMVGGAVQFWMEWLGRLPGARVCGQPLTGLAGLAGVKRQAEQAETFKKSSSYWTFGRDTPKQPIIKASNPHPLACARVRVFSAHTTTFAIRPSKARCLSIHKGRPAHSPPSQLTLATSTSNKPFKPSQKDNTLS